MTIHVLRKLDSTICSGFLENIRIGIQTHKHLVCKRTLNDLTKLAKWLSCIVSTYLHGAYRHISMFSFYQSLINIKTHSSKTGCY